MPTPLKLEVGKTYFSSEGEKVTIESCDPNLSRPFFGNNKMSYHEDGKHLQHQYNLVEEYKRISLEVGRSYINGYNDIVTIEEANHMVPGYPFVASNKTRYSVNGERRSAITMNEKYNLIAEVQLDVDLMLHHDSSIALNFEWFGKHQMGRGLVSFSLTDAERAANQYDPHPLFIHNYAEVTDETVLAAVESDCKELARLLNKFRISKEYLNAKAIALDRTERP